MTSRPHAVSVILRGGLIAGTLDIAYACVFWYLKAKVAPVRIFQSVAAGLLGPASFKGGIETAALGLGLHFLIALSFAVVYVVAARQWEQMRDRPWVFGAMAGLLLYTFMNYVVLPLSAAAPPSKDPLWIVLSVLVHVVFVGIPVALCARRG